MRGEEANNLGGSLLFCLAIAAAFVLALLVTLMGSVVHDDPADSDARTLAIAVAVLFVPAFLFVLAGLVTRPARTRWLTLALVLAAPALLLISGALTWLINSI